MVPKLAIGGGNDGIAGRLKPVYLPAGIPLSVICQPCFVTLGRRNLDDETQLNVDARGRL
jgi:hypothetical protein